jgi:hypothetical protein
VIDGCHEMSDPEIGPFLSHSWFFPPLEMVILLMNSQYKVKGTMGQRKTGLTKRYKEKGLKQSS